MPVRHWDLTKPCTFHLMEYDRIQPMGEVYSQGERLIFRDRKQPTKKNKKKQGGDGEDSKAEPQLGQRDVEMGFKGRRRSIAEAQAKKPIQTKVITVQGCVWGNAVHLLVCDVAFNNV